MHTAARYRITFKPARNVEITITLYATSGEEAFQFACDELVSILGVPVPSPYTYTVRRCAI